MPKAKKEKRGSGIPTPFPPELVFKSSKGGLIRFIGQERKADGLWVSVKNVKTNEIFTVKEQVFINSLVSEEAIRYNELGKKK